MTTQGQSGRAAAIVLAGGAGTRLRAADSKVYLMVAGRPLLLWSLRAFEASPLIADLALVVRESDVGRARELVTGAGLAKVRAVVAGGATRHTSEHAGLEAIADRIEAGAIDVVCVHDAARPFITHALIERVLDAARARGGAIPCLRVPEPALLRSGRADTVTEVVGTRDLRRVQTPQAFRAAELLTAHRRATSAGFEGVDTSEPAQRFGGLPVVAVEGDPDNRKVTYREDLPWAEEVARRWDPAGRP